MTEDNISRVSDNSSSKPRRKRKWDQPDESLVSSGVVVSGSLPTSTAVCMGLSHPGAVSAPGTILAQPLKIGNLNVTKDIQSQILPQQAVAVVQKLLQPKIQEDLVIAREIVINNADPSVRYKLTKRQTQEEIQKCTGAVVITRGKYRPPNAVPDSEKPLYLHISAGAHLKETAERILAVDRAAAMVEEMLKQVCQPLSKCVYLGFDSDPSLNIIARIRGPNDQYINHIINETGATVTLRGRGSGYLGNIQGEEGQQPLHLFLSSNNHKSLEEARLLAENLLDTISRECGATRASSCKVYSAVPPPQQLLTGVSNSGSEMTSNLSSAATLSCSPATTTPSPLVSSVVAPIATTAFPYRQVAQTAQMHPSNHSQKHGLPYSQALLPGCTSYSGYAGIYPQATPLQQVALALRQSSPVTSTVAPSTSATSMVSKNSVDAEKRRAQKRKFQESPAALVGVAVSQQGSNMQDLHKRLPSTEDKNILFSPSKKVDSLPSNGTVQTSLKSILPLPPPKNDSSMHPPASKSTPPRTYLRSILPPPPSKDNSSMHSPPKSMPPPPPPPKFTSTAPVKIDGTDHISHKSSSLAVPDTLVKLMEYGDDDDDTEENENEPFKSNPNRIAAAKPFWAV